MSQGSCEIRWSCGRPAVTGWRLAAAAHRCCVWRSAGSRTAPCWSRETQQQVTRETVLLRASKEPGSTEPARGLPAEAAAAAAVQSACPAAAGQLLLQQCVSTAAERRTCATHEAAGGSTGSVPDAVIHARTRNARLHAQQGVSAAAAISTATPELPTQAAALRMHACPLTVERGTCVYLCALAGVAANRPRACLLRRAHVTCRCAMLEASVCWPAKSHTHVDHLISTESVARLRC